MYDLVGLSVILKGLEIRAAGPELDSPKVKK